MRVTVHRIANTMPESSPEEYAALKADIAERGVQEPILVMADPGDLNHLQILSGRNRYRACKELAITPPFQLWSGTEDEAIMHVMGLEFLRRNISSGQKAAVAIEVEAMRRKLREEMNPTDDIEEPDAEFADRVAARTGTNRTYIFQCRRLLTDAPDLFAEVKAGAMTVPRAIVVYRSRLIAENPPEERKRGRPALDGEDSLPAKTKDVNDGAGRHVPKKLLPVFTARPDFQVGINLLAKFKEHVHRLASLPAGAMLDLSALEKVVDDATQRLKGLAPHVVCSDCKGKGCKACATRGWLTRTEHEARKVDERVAQGKSAEKPTGRSPKKTVAQQPLATS